jgi:hypothetical protein
VGRRSKNRETDGPCVMPARGLEILGKGARSFLTGEFSGCGGGGGSFVIQASFTHAEYLLREDKLFLLSFYFSSSRDSILQSKHGSLDRENERLR